MKLYQRIISAATTAALAVSMTVSPFAASAADAKGKYVQDVCISYGSSEEDAVRNLPEGYEAVKGDFNAGRHSGTAVVMGIKRTNDAKDAVTDMRVMDMQGRYSVSEYEELLGDKKNEIVQLIEGFDPSLKEFRENYKSANRSNKARADLAKKILDKFIDGDPAAAMAYHDTGKPLGELLLGQLSSETENYTDMSRNEQAEHGDLVQIILEGNIDVIGAMKQCLLIASDTNDNTWLDRIAEQQNAGTENGELESAKLQKLAEKYEDTSAILQKQWSDVNKEISFYCDYCDNHFSDEAGTVSLWQQDNETPEAYSERVANYFTNLQSNMNEEQKNDSLREQQRYMLASVLYAGLQKYSYKGEWGGNLLDFFFPAEGADQSYKDNVQNFYYLSAALSDGQRALLDVLNLQALLNIGMNMSEFTNDTANALLEPYKDVESVDLYSGINREVFRNNVAITSAAMESNNHYSLAGFFVGNTEKDKELRAAVALSSTIFLGLSILVLVEMPSLKNSGLLVEATNFKEDYVDQSNYNSLKRWRTFGVVCACLGALVLLTSVVAYSVAYYNYKNPTFTSIPNYIVDRADIEEFDENNHRIGLNFKDYMFYHVVQCNRQTRGVSSDAQDGVSRYAEWGCGNAADLNGDVGPQWLALYTVKNPDAGSPILADSLTLVDAPKKDENKTTVYPANCDTGLRLFNYEFSVNLGDPTFSYDSPKGGKYFFWKQDKEAFAAKTASVFSSGALAAASGVGAIAGALITALFLTPRRKKDLAA